MSQANRKTEIYTSDHLSRVFDKVYKSDQGGDGFSEGAHIQIKSIICYSRFSLPEKCCNSQKLLESALVME